MSEFFHYLSLTTLTPKPMLWYGLTPLGVFHTIISFVALFTGIFLMLRDHKITRDTSAGKVYVVSTIFVCVTGFGIYEHGGFGKAHVLGIITLLTLVLIYAAHKEMLGKSSRYIEMVAYTFTLFFHIVPTLTEGATRLPYGSPLAASPDDPGIGKAIGASLVLFVVISIFQVRQLKKRAVA